jgi:hypothetical protein
MIPMQRFL